MRHVAQQMVAGMAGLLFLQAAGPAPLANDALSEASVLLSIEPLLVDAGGIHPLTGARTDLIALNSWGEHHNILRLGAKGETSLYYVLSYKMSAGGRVQLRLERRSLRSSGTEEAKVLSAVEHEITPLEVWNTTLLADTGKGGRLDLRVVPVLRATAEDEPFDAARFSMRLHGGPLIHYGQSPPQDRVIFRELNGGGEGLQMGIPGVGIVKVSLRMFPGSAPCGWVRGHDLHLDFGEQEFKAWSTSPILPEDPERPGKGWILYGVLEPNHALKDDDGYYGGWNPGS